MQTFQTVKELVSRAVRFRAGSGGLGDITIGSLKISVAKSYRTDRIPPEILSLGRAFEYRARPVLGSTLTMLDEALTARIAAFKRRLLDGGLLQLVSWGVPVGEPDIRGRRTFTYSMLDALIEERPALDARPSTQTGPITRCW